MNIQCMVFRLRRPYLSLQILFSSSSQLPLSQAVVRQSSGNHQTALTRHLRSSQKRVVRHLVFCQGSVLIFVIKSADFEIESNFSLVSFRPWKKLKRSFKRKLMVFSILMPLTGAVKQ